MTSGKSAPYKLKYTFVLRKIGERHFAVATDANREEFSGAIRLNESGALIFQMLIQQASIDDMTNKLTEEYAIDEKTALHAVNSLLRVLKENQLLL